MALPVMQANYPVAGSIGWNAFSIQYNGVSYSILAGNTSKRWVWWRYNSGGGTTIIEAEDEVPDGQLVNLLTNGDFELEEPLDPTLPKGWLRPGAGGMWYNAAHTTALSTAQILSGTQSVALTTGVAGASGPNILQAVTLTPGVTYRVTFRARASVTNTQFYAIMLNSTGTAEVGRFSGLQPVTVTTSWQAYTGTMVIPAGVTAGRLSLLSYSQQVGYVTYVEDVEFGVNPAPGLVDDDLVLFGNKNGVPFRVQSSSFIDGDLLIDGSVAVKAIAADLIVANESYAKEGYIGKLKADLIDAGELSAQLSVISGGLTVGPYMSLTRDYGFKVVLSGKGEVNFPTDGSDPSITAKLTARELEIQDKLRVLGATNFVEGGLRLTGGTVAPLTAPKVTEDWDNPLAVFNSPNDQPTWKTRGFWDGGTHWEYLRQYSYTNTSQIMRIDKTTGERTVHLNLTPYATAASIVKIGNYYYVALSPISGKWYITRYDATTGAEDTAWNGGQRHYLSSTTSIIPEPCMATDGTYYYVIYRWTTGELRVNKYALTGGTSLLWWILYGTTSPWPTNDRISGAHFGSADYGAPRITITRTALPTSMVFGFNTALASGGTQTFYVEPGWTTPNVAEGLVWDGTRFLTHHPAVGLIQRLSKRLVDADDTYKFSWFDNNPTGGQHETPAGPAATVRMNSRRWIRVEAGTPNYLGGTDDVNAVRIYVNGQRQPDLATGASEAFYDGVFTTGTPDSPASNAAPGGFAGLAGNVGSFGSYDGTTIKLAGDNSWRMGHLAGKADGTNAMDTGWITATLTSSMAAYGDPNDTPVYRRVDNTVYLLGAMKPNVAGNLTTITTAGGVASFTIPVGYRPDRYNRIFKCQGSGDASWALQAFTTGVCYAARYGVAAPATGSWLPFAVSFLTADPFPII